MSWRAATTLAVLTTLASFARAAEPTGWRACLPADWLAVAVVDSLDQAESQLNELLSPWGRKTDGNRTRFEAFFPESPFADRPWAVALFEQEGDTVAPVLLAPTDDFAALCEALGADVADEIAVAVVGGFDIALIDRGGWAQVTLLDSTPNNDDLPADPEIAVLDHVADCGTRLAVSARGLDRVAEALSARRKGQLKIGRGRIPPWAWPSGFESFFDRLAPYAPLAEQLSQPDSPLAIGLRSDSHGDWGASLVLPIAAEPSEETPPGIPPGDRIASLRLSGKLPEAIVDLAISAMRCRPDDIDAPEYPQPQWDDLADAYRQLLGGCRAANFGLMLPGPGEPVATNEVSTFAWDGQADQLGDALALTVVRWNQVVDAAKSRTPLRVVIEPMAGQGGWRLSTDLFTGFAVERSPEIEALFERCYGGDTLSLDVKPAGDGTWIASRGPTKYGEVPPAPATARPMPPNVFLAGELRLDRWFAWQQQIEDATMGDAIGRKVRPPMDEAPPATLRATSGDALRFDATLPATTYEAAVRYWRADKVRP